MKQIYKAPENPLLQGIKVIGIGKHGSKPLPYDQINNILDYINTQEVVPIQKGAFYGSLLAKEPTMEEERLLLGHGKETEVLYNWLCDNAPAAMRALGVKLLRKQTLSAAEALELGSFLYSDLPGETFRGMAASMLRMRYETEEEYQGLYKAVVSTYSPGFQNSELTTETVIQLAEPFDGVEHSYMITPLLARLFRQQGFPVVVTMGRSAGPKYTLNALDLYQKLAGQFMQQSSELTQPTPEFGWALDQQLLSPALDQWVDRRRLLFKRPFLATLEKVLNPCKASVLITSVFHITYIERMIALAGMAGFSGVIVLKRGLEGTLAPSVAKASGITCAVLQQDGSFLTQTFEASQEAFSFYRAEADAVVQNPTAEANVQLTRQFISQGLTGNEDFDKRVNLAYALYQQGLEWIRNNWPATSS